MLLHNLCLVKTRPKGKAHQRHKKCAEAVTHPSSNVAHHRLTSVKHSDCGHTTTSVKTDSHCGRAQFMKVWSQKKTRKK